MSMHLLFLDDAAVAEAWRGRGGRAGLSEWEPNLSDRKAFLDAGRYVWDYIVMSLRLETCPSLFSA
jgi:hypothetical protein